MFGFKKSQVVVDVKEKSPEPLVVDVKEKSPEPSIPEPSIKQVTPEELLSSYNLPSKDIFEEYQELATDLGLSNCSFKAMKLVDFLQRNEIPVYDTKLVGDYLLKKAESNKEYQSRLELWRESTYVFSNEPTITMSWCLLSNYKEQIPIEGLRLVSKIKKEFGEPIITEVSNVEYSYPAIFRDPFLSVRMEGDTNKTRFVIFKWDEPGFTVA